MSVRSRVLVVDDSSSARAVACRLLEREGFEVLQACDGAEGAMVALREAPDLVVTDLEMPTMDGCQLARLLKGDPSSRDLPVLILTSHDEARARYWGLQTGADAYLTKEAVDVELVPAVRRLIAAAPPRTSRREPAPGRPVEVLARVARSLDANLLEATFVNALLARGLPTASLKACVEVTLATLSEVTDAEALAVATADEQATAVYVYFPAARRPAAAERLAGAMRAELGAAGKGRLELDVIGGDEGGEEISLDSFVSLSLPSRGATTVLGLIPRDPEAYRTLALPLVEAVIDQLALVLDNARLAERLRELSAVDGLTRLLNHRTVLDRLDHELERAERYGHSLSVVLADIDHFKRVNDRHGHLVGDAVLREVARTMREGVRAADVAGRYGGEEFLLLLPETGLEAACQMAERLRDRIAEAKVTSASGESVGVTASFGVASIEELERHGAEALVSLADTRLYASKEAGRDRVTPASGSG